MLSASLLPRVFVLKEREQDIRLSDPSGTFSPEQVMDFYSGVSSPVFQTIQKYNFVLKFPAINLQEI